MIKNIALTWIALSLCLAIVYALTGYTVWGQISEHDDIRHFVIAIVFGLLPTLAGLVLLFGYGDEPK